MTLRINPNTTILAIDTIKETIPCSNTTSAANGTADAGTGDKNECKNGVSQYVLAPMIAVASLFAFLA